MTKRKHTFDWVDNFFLSSVVFVLLFSLIFTLISIVAWIIHPNVLSDYCTQVCRSTSNLSGSDGVCKGEGLDKYCKCREWYAEGPLFSPTRTYYIRDNCGEKIEERTKP